MPVYSLLKNELIRMWVLRPYPLARWRKGAYVSPLSTSGYSPPHERWRVREETCTRGLNFPKRWPIQIFRWPIRDKPVYSRSSAPSMQLKNAFLIFERVSRNFLSRPPGFSRPPFPITPTLRPKPSWLRPSLHWTLFSKPSGQLSTKP